MEQKTLLKNKKNQGNGGETMAKRDDSVKKKVPELRFKGFTDDWEERKLGDITKISTGKLDANAMVENGKYDFYTSGIKKYRTDVAAFEGPSITIAGNGATVGYMHLADNKFNAYQRTYVLQEFLVDRSFIFSEIGNKLPKKIKQEARTGNIPYIVMDMLTELKLSIPQNNSEQQKIGSFFKQLDNTIALHQRKLDLLKEQKKGFSQKMFPKNGEKVPELRFAGFADDWELRKIEDILKNIKGSMKIGPFGSALKKEYYVEKGIKVYTQENIFKNDFSLGNYYITEDKYLELQSCELIPGDIVISMMGTIGACSVFPETSEKGIMNSHLLRLQINDSSLAEYIALQIKDSPFIKQQILKLSVGSIMSGLSSTVVKKLKFPIPSIEEQRKIYLFFKQLDDTIALHQRKLDLLKEQKKGFLQKMFV